MIGGVLTVYLTLDKHPDRRIELALDGDGRRQMRELLECAAEDRPEQFRRFDNPHH